MSFVRSIATLVPPHTVTAAEAEEQLRPFFAALGEDPATVSQIFANAHVERRHLAKPQAFYLRERGLTARNAAYVEVARELGVEVARQALAQADVDPKAVDLVVDTSCTGIMIPSLDATLVNALGLRDDVVRLPLTEIGCAAGAVALSRADDYLRAYPDATALVVTVELPSLTLQLGDGSRANLVSSAIFGDGAAAAVVGGQSRSPGLEVVAHKSVLFPDSIDLMGFDLRSEGFQIVLSQRIPAVVKRELRPRVDAFLAEQELTLADLSFYALHPGGTRVLDNLRDVLELSEDDVHASRDCLRRFGNLSSASVLFVARDVIDAGQVEPGALGLACAMGPGFSLEMLLLRGH